MAGSNPWRDAALAIINAWPTLMAEDQAVRNSLLLTGTQLRALPPDAPQSMAVLVAALRDCLDQFP